MKHGMRDVPGLVKAERQFLRREEQRRRSKANISSPLTWRRDGDSWVLLAGRRRFGRVVPAQKHAGMWRSLKSDGQLSDMSNLSWAKNAVLPVKAPPPAPVYSWTGWYAGGNIGYSWGKADTDFSSDPIIINDPTRGLITLPGFAGSDSVKPNGIIGGGQIGYNWQYSPNWVAGVEADIQASGEKASNTFTNAFTFFPPYR